MAVLGIDLGTSGCKTALVDHSGAILASATASYSLSAPRLLWSEQDPEHWWRGVVGSKGTQCAGKIRRETRGASPPHRKE